MKVDVTVADNDGDGIGVFKHVLLLEALQTKDFFFLQAGAHDGITFDPLRNFAKRFGWRGVVLEPQPAVYAKLLENYRDCPGVTCLNVAVGTEDGDLVLYKFRDGPDVPEHATMLASFNRDALEYNSHGYAFPIVESNVKAMSLRTIVEKYCDNNITLLQTDTEGFDYFIMRQLFDLDEACLPQLIRFENAMSAEQLNELRVRLKSKGYKIEAFCEHGAPDVIATRRDFGDLDDRRIAVTHAPPPPRPSPPIAPLPKLPEPFETALQMLPPQVERELGKLLCTLGFPSVGGIVFDKATARGAVAR